MTSSTPQPGNEGNPPVEEQIDALLSNSEAVQARPSPAPADDAADVSAAEIESLLDAPPTPASLTEQTVDAEPDPEQAEMLSALNTALQDLPEDPPSDAPAPEASTEEQLQDEIAALMNAEPEIVPVATATHDDADDFDALGGSFESPESLGIATQAAPAQAQSSEVSVEDQIAMEIEGLLDVDEAPAPPTASTADASPAQEAIDELDKMLADEIDSDDELAGDFQSVEDITAGIEVQDELQGEDHAATARDVAAELDSQPEDLRPSTEPAAPETEPAATGTLAALDEQAPPPEPSRPDDQRRAALEVGDPPHWIETARERLLSACFLINWPARRFLTAEWRANLGYIALLNLFFGLGLWIVLIVF